MVLELSPVKIKWPLLSVRGIGRSALLFFCFFLLLFIIFIFLI